MELLIALILAIVILYLLISLVINTSHIAESLEDITSILKAEGAGEVAAAVSQEGFDGLCEGCGKAVSRLDRKCPSCGLRIKL
jgi:hypothetical protein